MPRVPFAELPDHGRLWVFPVSRRLDEIEATRLLADVDDFLDGWAAHGAPLRSARELRERHFLLIGVDVDSELPSGCSIDALTNRLRTFGESVGATLIDHASVWYRGEGEIRSSSRAGFKSLAADGRLEPSVPVFDTSLVRVSQLRDGALEKPASESWHGRAFFGDRAAL